MQNITIAGRLGRDAEVRSTQNGDSVCSFSVAVDYRAGKEKATNWYRVSLWGKRGEGLAQYLTKGTTVAVSGEFSTSEYEGKTQLNVRASEITLLGGNRDEGQREAPRSTGNGGGYASRPSDDLGDDIPF